MPDPQTVETVTLLHRGPCGWVAMGLPDEKFGERRAVLVPEGAEAVDALIETGMDAVPGLYHEPVVALAKAWGLLSEEVDADDA